MKFSLSHPLVRFLGVAIVLYLGWYVLYEFVLHPKYTTELINGKEVRVERVRLDDHMNANLKWLSGNGLRLLGYDLIPEFSPDPNIRTVGVDGTHGLWIGDECNGLKLFALFSCVIIAFPGPWRKKLWFIPFGILAIHLINVIRIIGLALVVLYAPQSLDFNHNVTFTITVYSFIFLLWYWWAKKFANLNTKPEPEA